MIDQIKIQLKTIFENDSSGHDYSHTLRVYNNALAIAKNESCDTLLVSLAALLHDVDDPKLFNTQDHSNARKIMTSCGIDDEIQEKVISIIIEVPFKGCQSTSPSTIEGKIVQDADRLDALGAIGIARTFAYGGYQRKSIYDPDIPPNTTLSAEEYLHSPTTSINHFYEKLFHLKRLMNTDTARNLAEERDKYMHDFVNKFLSEWKGIDTP